MQSGIMPNGARALEDPAGCEELKKIRRRAKGGED